MHLKKLPRSFYLRPTLNVARKLLGAYLCRRVRGKTLIGRIVEVEAYLGELDPASHAYRGKTKRNEVMFWNGGHLYVYFTYGMHFCSNVVTEREGIGRAVLLRAIEPVAGIEIMKKNRKLNTTTLHNLTNGPAKLCQALGITRPENGADLCGRKIWIGRDSSERLRQLIKRSTRIGITDGKDHRWRFYLGGNHFVSRTKPVR